MSSMQRDLARTMIQARQSAAQREHLADRASREKRDARRVERSERRAVRTDERAARRAAREAALGAGWWPRWTRRTTAPVVPALATAAGPTPDTVASELDDRLRRLADRIVEHGTEVERIALETVADATRWTVPGAAAALVDWDGTEIARLRAFGVLHGSVGRLGPEDQAWLLDRLRDPSAAEPGTWVA